MEKAAVFAGAHLINDVRLEIDVEGAWNVLSRRRFREKCAEAVGTVRGIFKATVGLYPFQYMTRKNIIR